MKLRFKISGTGWLCAVPDFCPPGEENWTPICQLSEEQKRQVGNYQNMVNRIENNIKDWSEKQAKHS